MSLKDPREQWAVWHNPFIVDFNLSIGITNCYLDFGFDTTIFWFSSSTHRIPIFASLRVVQKLSLESLGALSVLHAGRAGIDITARTMYHVFDDYIKQTGISLRIG